MDSPPPYSQEAIPPPPTCSSHNSTIRYTDTHSIDMTNNNNARSAPKATVATAWNELDFRKSMGWQSVCKFGIVTLAVVIVTISIASVATVLIVKYLGPN
jgi:hypothetical protein